jgi:hypothetical protein
MIEIKIPQLTHPLSINEANRMHWAAKRRRLEPWRIILLATIKAQNIEPITEPVNIKVSLSFKRKVRRDPHNYVGTVVKKIVDTIVESGIIPDDTAEYVTVIDPKILINDSNEAIIIIESRDK